MGLSMKASEVEALPWVEVESSNVRRVAWVAGMGSAEEGTPAALWLWVEFTGSSGRVYRYEGVIEEQYTELVEADSVGGYLNAEIKPSHKCERWEVVADAPED